MCACAHLLLQCNFHFSQVRKRIDMWQGAQNETGTDWCASKCGAALVVREVAMHVFIVVGWRWRWRRCCCCWLMALRLVRIALHAARFWWPLNRYIDVVFHSAPNFTQYSTGWNVSVCVSHACSPFILADYRFNAFHVCVVVDIRVCVSVIAINCAFHYGFQGFQHYANSQLLLIYTYTYTYVPLWAYALITAHHVPHCHPFIWMAIVHFLHACMYLLKYSAYSSVYLVSFTMSVCVLGNVVKFYCHRAFVRHH